MRTPPGSIVFGIAVGLIVAVTAYRWITAPEGRAVREQEEAAVIAARASLGTLLGQSSLETVDPLVPRRSVGKTYVYPVADGWEISGFYRRSAADRWHPFLLRLDESLSAQHLKVHDASPALLRRAAKDERLEVSH